VTQIYEIRLVISRDSNGFTARWIVPNGQASNPFTLNLPLRTKDAAELRWYLEEYCQFPGTGDRVRARDLEKQLNTWGRKLFDSIFDNSEGAYVYSSLAEAAKNHRTCLLTIGATDPDILTQPWEMMRDKRGPLAFQGITIRRQLKGAGIPRDFQLGLPMRVLLIVSRPKDVGFIDPRNSIAPILDALESLSPTQVKVDFCDPPTLGRLEETISEARESKEPYHIVHFDGHGTYLPKTGVGALAFERDDAGLHLVTGTQLGDLLVKLEIPLAILEACRGSDLSDKPVFDSVAPALLECGVGSVMAFSHSVHIEASRLLVERFYQELVAGKSIGQALESARAHMHANPARFLHLGPNADSVDLQDWFIPQLYQVGDDPVLIKLKKAKAKAEPKQKRSPQQKNWHNFPPPPMYSFHGRAMELLEMERSFRRHHAVVLSGMGGMGKTALAREAAAWWLRTGRFEAAVFCSFEQRAGAEQVVRLIGQALEGDQFSSRSADDQWNTAVDLFRSKRLLVVWDNFESTLPTYQLGELATPALEVVDGSKASESVLSFGEEARARLTKLYRDMTDNSPAGRLMVTCRPAETGLPGIKEMSLGGLKRPDSLYLLAAILDIKGISTDRDGYERRKIDALLDMLTDHPLSIELVAPHLKELTPAQIQSEFGQLLDRFADAGAFEARNKSLLASLEFSKKRLSEQAQKVLPYLSWFEGGVFEKFLLDFTKLDTELWAAIKSELVATALISAEDVGFKFPYLRFHPTLPYAAKSSDVPNPEEAEKRFIEVYSTVAGMAENGLRGQYPAAGMALLAREEANVRNAIRRAFRRGDQQQAWLMANTLGIYLQMAGRLRERDALVAWVKDQLPEGEKLDEAICDAIREHAWSRFTQGYAEEAIQMVQDLISRLKTEGLADEKDPTFQLALSNAYLGRLYYHSGHAALSVEPLQKAITGFEKIDDKENLAAALGDVANAYQYLGRFDEALKAAERGLTIDRKLGRDREIAAGLGQIARILMEQQRYAESEERYEEALEAARAAGDLDLQGSLLQNQGILQRRIGNHDRAIDLYKQAITSFQQSGATGGEMRTCDLLGTVESERGHLDAAEAWYKRSRELAEQLNDQYHLASVAQNVGILYQTRAEQATDPTTRADFLRQAIAFVKESLATWIESKNQVFAASSYFQLGILHHKFGELEQAEDHAQQGLKISESLNLPDVWKDYNLLADIARDRGDTEAAAQWEAKRDAKLAKVRKLWWGEGTEAQEAKQLDQLAEPILALAQAAYFARTSNTPLPPEAAEVLAQLAEAPPPLNDVAAFLQSVAKGQAPPPPANLPPKIKEILEVLAEQCRTEVK
jgi:tetratricopeptide (TPR) repeat protein